MPAGMQITAKYAVQNAERRLYDALVTAMGAINDETAFLAEYGKFAPESEFFKFALTNPTEEQKEPQAFWTFGAEFEGVYKSRAAGWQAWGVLVDFLKRTVNCDFLEGVVSLRFNPGQPLDRILMEANVDTGTDGGQVRRWVLRVPMTANFVNTEPEIAGESNDTRND